MKKELTILAAVAALALNAKPLPERAVIRATGPWEMAQATAPDKWMQAKVPGTVLTTLVMNGIVPDPYIGLNNKLELKVIPDLADNRDFYTATFRSRVHIPAEFKGKVVWMRPEGINYRSEIYLNGEMVASTRGMFSRTPVDVSEYVKVGEMNDLKVKVWPVDHAGRPAKKQWGAANEWSNGGDGEIGRDVTMLMSAGWDFTFSDGIRDRNAGIWRDITFFATDEVRIDAPFVRTKLNADMSEAELELEVDCASAYYDWGKKMVGTLRWTIEGTDIVVEKPVDFFRGERRTEHLKAKLANPKLWWPVNKGRQDMYPSKVELLTVRRNGRAGLDFSVTNVSDKVEFRFGVRELTSDESGLGGARQFFCNRRPIFIRGTNWIPEAMLKADDARMEKELRLTAESGVNLVRHWGGGLVESDYFYQLCDEYGLLVWQEFWMTGDTRHPDDVALYLDNVEQSLKRVRMHPCLAHYVNSNESTETAGCEALVKRLTGTTSWMQNSECAGVHDGSPYYPINPMRYYEDTGSDRGSRIYGFSPEYGTCAMPCAEQVRKFMPEELLWPMNVEAWKYREGGGFDRMTEYHNDAVNCYGESKTFEEYSRKSQAVDAISHRALWEAWNLARNHATGVLFWYNNTPIPQLGSHAWDYDLNQEAAFFAQKSALAPLHVQYEYLSNRVSVVSDVYGDRQLKVRAEVWDFDSKKVWEKEAPVTALAEKCVDVFKIPFEELSLSKPHFIRLWLMDGEKTVDSTFYWRSCDRYEGKKTVTGPCTSGFAALEELPKTTLTFKPTEDGLKVVNSGDKIAFMVRVRCVDGEGRLVVPVNFSDNYFSLLPGEEREVRIDTDRPMKNVKFAAWNTDEVAVR